MAKENLYDKVESDGYKTRIEEKLKGLENEYENHIFDNSHEAGEKQSAKYRTSETPEDSFKDRTDYHILVAKDRSNTVLEGSLRFDEDTGKYLFTEAFNSTGTREIDPKDYYDLLGNKVEDNSPEPLLDKEQVKKTGRLDVPLIKTLEASFGKETVDKVLDATDRVYLKNTLGEINARGKMEYINTVGGLAYLLDAVTKSYSVDYNGNKLERAPILSRLYVEGLKDDNEAFKMSNLVNHDVRTGEKSFKEITDLLMSSQNNPDILYDKVLFLSNAEHYEHSVHTTDSNFYKFMNTMATKRFDLVNVIVALTSAFIIYSKGFDFKDAFRIAFRLYPPMAGANQSVAFLLTAKGHAERKEIWDAINDYAEAKDNPEKFVEKRGDLLDKRVGDKVDVPEVLKDLDKSDALTNVEVRDKDKFDVTVVSDKGEGEATVSVERDDDETKVTGVSVETKDKDDKDVVLSLEVKGKEDNDKVDKKVENSKDFEKKTEQKVEKKSSKKDKTEKNKDKVEKKNNVKDVIEATKGALEKGDLSKIKDGLEKNGYEIEKATETPVDKDEKVDFDFTDKDENKEIEKDKDKTDVDTKEDIESALLENSRDDIDEKSSDVKDNDKVEKTSDHDDKIDHDEKSSDKDKDDEEDDDKDDFDKDYEEDNRAENQDLGIEDVADLMMDYDY